MEVDGKEEPLMTYGGSIQNPFSEQFEGNELDLLPFSICPIHYFNEEGALLPIHATGFIVREKGRNFLVSAYHCLTGLNPANGKCSSPTGFIPKRIRVFPATRLGNTITRHVVDIDLNDGVLTDPNFSVFRTDIAAIELNDPAEFVSADSTSEKLHTTAGSQCFVVGFPLPQTSALHIPIWRRASFATDPTIAIDGKPLFYVDAYTSPGMSGSPIFQRVFGPVAHYGEGGLKIEVDRVVTTRLVGVYAGRIHDSQAAGPIGYGWYANRINAILTQKHSDTVFDLGLDPFSLTPLWP